jgi:isoleucyl-tRNA synthetase
MSKSMGNVVAPKTVINRYGAEILRMWVSASDYRDDVRISDNILNSSAMPTAAFAIPADSCWAT